MKPEKGTMAAADAKSERIMKIILTVLTLMAFSLSVLGVPRNDWHEFALKSDGAWRVVSTVIFAASIGVIWWLSRKLDNAFLLAVLWVVLAGLGFWASSGFTS